MNLICSSGFIFLIKPDIRLISEETDLDIDIASLTVCDESINVADEDFDDVMVRGSHGSNVEASVSTRLQHDADHTASKPGPCCA